MERFEDMTLSWQINQSRYRHQGNSAIQGYARYTDCLTGATYEVKELPRLSPVEEALEFWGRIRHPAFLPVVHVFEEPSRLLVFMEEMPAGVSLATLDALQVKGELIFDCFCELARAIQFMSQQMLSYPHLDLTKIYVTASGLKIIGHESVPSLSTWQRDQVHPIDLRYAPSEWASQQGRTETADVYHLGALFFHFLTRIPAGADPENLRDKIPDRFHGMWLPLFKQLLQKESKKRLGWKELWKFLELQAPKSTAKYRTPLLLGKKCDELVQFAHRCFNDAESKPLVLNMLVPGGDPFGHCATLHLLAEKRNWMTVWTAASPSNHPYQALNQLIQYAQDARLATLNPFHIAEQLQPLTTWDAPLCLVRRWKRIVKRLVDALKAHGTSGLFVLITDAQHLDKQSVEALAYFLTLMEGFPVVLGLGTEQLGCVPLQHLNSIFPRNEHYAGQTIDRSWLEARLWAPQALETAWMDRLLEETGQREILVPLWLADSNGNCVQAYFEKNWDSLTEAERQFLLLTACSPRQISEAECLALLGTKAAPDIAKLVLYGWLVSAGNGRFRFSSIKGKDRCLEKLSAHERQLLFKRLLVHERRLEKPDLVQLCCLALLLEDPSSKELLQRLRAQIYEQLDLESLWAVEKLASNPAFKCLQEYSYMAAVVRGEPIKQRAHIKDVDYQEFARIQGLRGKEPRRGAELYLALSGRRKLGPVKRGYSLVLAVEYAVRGNDTLQANRALRRLARMDTHEIDPEWVESWWARCLGALRQLGQEPVLALGNLKRDRTPLLRWAAACQAWHAHRFEQCLELLEEVMPQLDNFYDLDWRGLLLKQYGNALYRNYQPERAIQAYQQALICFQKTDNVTCCEDVFFNLASAESLAGHFDSSRASSLAIYNKAIAANDAVTRCQVLYQIMACDLLQNDVAAFERSFAEHQTHCNQLGFVTERVKSLALRAEPRA